MATALTAVPAVSDALPAQESGPDGSDADGEIDLDIDVQRASEVDIEQAMGDVRENVEAQRAQLADAQRRVADAEAGVLAAQAKVAETQAEIDQLTAQSDEVVVRAFTAPPRETAIEALSTESARDAAVKFTVLDMQATADAGVLEDLADAKDELGERQDAERAAVAEADARRADADAALTDLRAALSQEAEFTVEVENRLNHQLGEIATLEEIDPDLAAQLRSQQDALAAAVAEARQRLELEEYGVDGDQMGPDGPSSIRPVSGGVVAVTCPSGGSIEVAGVIARNVQGLLNLAHAQGLTLCGYGFRDPSDQIALRRANCGSSNYAIYQAPPSSCSPPTAIPGSSMHEQGLAIDFTSGGGGTIGCRSSAYGFLQDNAADYDLYNLPGECWHWSTNGQ